MRRPSLPNRSGEKRSVNKILSASTVYLILSFSSAFFFSLIFTVNLVYHVSRVGLDPLQIVLVGTALESVVFLFEIPTGVVADVKSRKLSIIIGFFIIGLGFILEGSWPIFMAVLMGQAVWGLGHTFTSGAVQAWAVEEIGEEKATQTFLRGTQARQAGNLVGILPSVALAHYSLQLPIILGGASMVLLSLFLMVFMPENNFRPLRTEDRQTWRAMGTTLREAGNQVRRAPALITILLVGLFFGLYSEGLDRLWTMHLLENFRLPGLGPLKPVVWFGVIKAVAILAGLAGTEAVRRWLAERPDADIGRVLIYCATGIVIFLAGFSLATSVWVALIFFLIIGVLRMVSGPLQNSWLNQSIDEPGVRATIFSVSGQADALGQVMGGPVVGFVGKIFSVKAALSSSALLLTPAPVMIAVLETRKK